MENEDIFYDKLKEMIFEVYESPEENYNEKLNNLKTFFGFNFGDKNTLDEQKLIYCTKFSFFVSLYLKEWLVNFISSSILKIYKNEVNSDLLINNNYFIFKFLGNKLIINLLIKRNIDLINLILIFYAKIYTNPKNFSLVIDYKNNIDNDLNENLKKIKKILKEENEIDYSIFTSEQKIKKIFDFKIFFLEERYVDVIDDGYFFEKKDNSIFISDFFKIIISLFFGFNFKEILLSLDTNDEEKIKKQFYEIIEIIK